MNKIVETLLLYHLSERVSDLFVLQEMGRTVKSRVEGERNKQKRAERARGVGKERMRERERVRERCRE